MEPDIFKPHIILEEMAGAGMVKIKGGGYASNDLEYDANSGSPYQSAYNEAFKLALATQIPMWRKVNWDTYECLYHPDVRSLTKPKEEVKPEHKDAKGNEIEF